MNETEMGVDYECNRMQLTFQYMPSSFGETKTTVISVDCTQMHSVMALPICSHKDSTNRKQNLRKHTTKQSARHSHKLTQASEVNAAKCTELSRQHDLSRTHNLQNHISSP
ncbi:hypothetical protein KC19_VG154700 [Ceratodon purpureus]|uniref:Uncharacterized protein n=1 Tax=Ceratodon purpureus TaxID=3225 RepID=A0A8T0HQH7_CERPU|nr:hypothetical protein KC19_VG154700 [Ceratodon purpureus]